MTKPFRNFDDEQVTLKLELNPDEVYKDDPGQGTPAMVIMYDSRKREIDSGTYWCATGEGELSYNGTKLTEEMAEWLDSKSAIVDRFIEKYAK